MKYVRFSIDIISVFINVGLEIDPIKQIMDTRDSQETVSKEWINKIDKIFIRLTKENSKLKNKLDIAHKEIKKLQEQVNSNKYAQLMSKIFNGDQMKIVTQECKKTSWCNDTILKALRLKFTCGTPGYSELLS